MPHQVRQDKLFGHFVSDILGLSNAHTSMGAAFALLCLAPSEPTCFGSAMKIHKCIFAALTSLTFHVEHI